MGVRIEADEGCRLRFTGDIEAYLDIPLKGDAEAFSLAISDGTLVRGSYPDGNKSCRFSVLADGAATIRIARSQAGDVLDIDWKPDWIVLGRGTKILVPNANHDDENVLQLTLDIEVREAA